MAQIRRGSETRRESSGTSCIKGGRRQKGRSSCVMAGLNTALVLMAICLGANAWVPPVVGRSRKLAARSSLATPGRSAAPLKMGLESEDEGEGEEEAEEGINWMPPLTMTAEVEKEEGAQVCSRLEGEGSDRCAAHAPPYLAGVSSVPPRLRGVLAEHRAHS